MLWSERTIKKQRNKCKRYDCQRNIHTQKEWNISFFSFFNFELLFFIVKKTYFIWVYITGNNFYIYIHNVQSSKQSLFAQRNARSYHFSANCFFGILHPFVRSTFKSVQLKSIIIISFKKGFWLGEDFFHHAHRFTWRCWSVIPGNNSGCGNPWWSL